MKRTYDCRLVHTGDDCSLHFNNEVFVYRDLKACFPDGCKVTVSIQTRRKPRSLKQNAVLHWYINAIADETGMDAQDVKEVLRHRFLSEDIVDRNGEIMADKGSGEVLKRYKSTAELSTVEMMAFTEEIRVWSLDFLGLPLPLPNEEVELKLTNKTTLSSLPTGFIGFGLQGYGIMKSQKSCSLV